MCYSQIWQNFGGDEYFCKLGKEYHLFFTAFWNFWRITRLSTINHHSVINAQTGPVFLAHPVVSHLTQHLILHYLGKTQPAKYCFLIQSSMIA